MGSAQSAVSMGTGVYVTRLPLSLSAAMVRTMIAMVESMRISRERVIIAVGQALRSVRAARGSAVKPLSVVAVMKETLTLKSVGCVVCALGLARERLGGSGAYVR